MWVMIRVETVGYHRSPLGGFGNAGAKNAGQKLEGKIKCKRQTEQAVKS